MAGKSKHPPKQEHEDERIDEAADESFPASDPPSWSAAKRTGQPAPPKKRPPAERPSR